MTTDRRIVSRHDARTSGSPCFRAWPAALSAFFISFGTGSDGCDFFFSPSLVTTERTGRVAGG